MEGTPTTSSATPPPSSTPAATTSAGRATATTYYHRTTDESGMARMSAPVLRCVEQAENPGNYNYIGPGFFGPTFKAPPGLDFNAPMQAPPAPMQASPFGYGQQYVYQPELVKRKSAHLQWNIGAQIK